mgnify:CR=1 FL=1
MSIINTIPEITFIAGTTYIIDFTFADANGSPADLRNGVWTFRMARYGETTHVLSKSYAIPNSATAVYTVQVTLNSSDTLGLSGVYSHQSTLEYNGNGVLYKPAQGIMHILPAIQ